MRPPAAPALSPRPPGPPAKVQPWHLERLAVVYVRQSSPFQVLNYQESAHLQYSLRDLAVAWGWPADRVLVIDEDQGHTATTTEQRPGFQRVLTEVNLNHVGVILGFQMSRLCRSNRDWYDLLERCAVFHTLLADQEGIYDPMVYNDRLLLGLKGTMSEAELHLMRERLTQGRMNKARRGALFTTPPMGYVRSPAGGLELDPDDQVRHVVRLVFDKFDELGSVGEVLRYLTCNDIQLGFRVHGGSDSGRLEWRPAIRPTLTKILHHPAYAGYYVYGMTHVDPRRRTPGRPHSGRTAVAPEDWAALIPGQVPSYITQERYRTNQLRLASNRSLPTTAGAPRSGPSLLAGMVVCGRCGRRMQVAYHAKHTPVYYECTQGAAQRATPACQRLSGESRPARHSGVPAALRRDPGGARRRPGPGGAGARGAGAEPRGGRGPAARAQAPGRALAAAVGAGEDRGRSGGAAVPCGRAREPPGGARAGGPLGGRPGYAARAGRAVPPVPGRAARRTLRRGAPAG
jgi:DNA invertase Pin-like site-specific DNA recombinase